MHVRQLTTAADHEAAARLAYEIYVEENNILGDAADHDRRLLYSDDAEHTTSFGVFSDDQLVGTISALFGADAPFSEFYRRVFRIDAFEVEVPMDKMVITTRLLVRSEFRRSMAKIQLFFRLLTEVLECGVLLNFADCQAHLFPSYETLGFRACAAPFDYGANGAGIPMVGALMDLDYIRSISSPLLHQIAPEIQAQALAGRIRAIIEDHEPIVSPKSAPEAFDAIISGLHASRAGGSDDPFRGMGETDLKAALRTSYSLDCPAGVKLIGGGQRTRTVYVVVDGELTVTRGAHRARIGPGEIFGEISYLLNAERTADVVVSSPPARLICLDRRAMKALSDTGSPLAAHFLGNLSRILARRMAEAS